MNKIKTAIASALVIFLFVPGLFTLLGPQKIYSENENRYLQQIPSLSWTSLKDGTFQSEFSDFLSDQVPMRDKLTAASSGLKRFSGRKDISGAYIGKDDYYFEKITDSDISYERYEKNLKKLEKLAEENPGRNYTAMFVPSSGIVLKDKLPAGAEMYDSEKMLALAESTLTGYKLADPTKTLAEHADSRVFYRTDHHWTAYGAYLSYRLLMGDSGAATSYNVNKVSDKFRGTLYSKVLDSGAVYDSVSVPVIPNDIQVTADGEQIGMYDMAALKQKDKYQVYQGGNHGLVTVKGKGEGSLIILKDSFANSFVPYLVNDYETIVMIDLRYFAGTVSTVMDECPDADVLVLYELSNFANDTSVVKLSLK